MMRAVLIIGVLLGLVASVYAAVIDPRPSTVVFSLSKEDYKILKDELRKGNDRVIELPQKTAERLLDKLIISDWYLKQSQTVYDGLKKRGL